MPGPKDVELLRTWGAGENLGYRGNTERPDGVTNQNLVRHLPGVSPACHTESRLLGAQGSGLVDSGDQSKEGIGGTGAENFSLGPDASVPGSFSGKGWVHLQTEICEVILCERQTWMIGPMISLSHREEQKGRRPLGQSDKAGNCL